MAGFSRLDVAIREAEEARLDLGRARLLLTTAQQLVREERQEINRLRRALNAAVQISQDEVGKLAKENEALRQQLWELSRVRSRQMGLEPREPLRLFPMEET